MTNPDEIKKGLQGFLAERTKTTVGTDADLFASGLVNSMFAMELVVHLEQNYGVAVQGPDLRMANFKTIDAMTALVLRLSQTAAGV